MEINSLDSVPFVASEFYWTPVDATDIIRLVLSFKPSSSMDIYGMYVEFLKKTIYVIALI